MRDWIITGPDGFRRIVTTSDKETERLALVLGVEGIHTSDLACQAGYRAEPIEEPKMVTVRAEDLHTLCNHAYRASSEWPATVRVAADRLLAALNGAK